MTVGGQVAGCRSPPVATLYTDSSVRAKNTDGLDEGHSVPGHCLHCSGSLTLGCANAPVVEDNDAAPRGDAVDDPRIPPVKFRCQMIEEDNRHSGVWPESSVDEFCPADIDAGGGRITSTTN